jgi:hypothetical protein
VDFDVLDGMLIFMAGTFQVNALISPSAAGRSGAADTGSLRQKIQKMRISKPASIAADAWHPSAPWTAFRRRYRFQYARRSMVPPAVY